MKYDILNMTGKTTGTTLDCFISVEETAAEFAFAKAIERFPEARNWRLLARDEQYKESFRAPDIKVSDEAEARAAIEAVCRWLESVPGIKTPAYYEEGVLADVAREFSHELLGSARADDSCCCPLCRS